MSDSMHSSWRRGPWSAIFVWFVFFCFSMVLASLPQMQKPLKKKQKQNNRHHAQLWDWRRGPWNLPFFVFSRFWSVSQKCKRFLQWDMGEEQLSSKWFPDKPFQYQFLLLSAQLLLWYQIDFAECNRLASSAAIWYHILSSYSIAEFLLCHALVLRQSHRRIQCQSLIVLYRSSTWYSLSFCTLRCMRSDDIDREMGEEQLGKRKGSWQTISPLILSVICSTPLLASSLEVRPRALDDGDWPDVLGASWSGDLWANCTACHVSVLIQNDESLNVAPETPPFLHGTWRAGGMPTTPPELFATPGTPPGHPPTTWYPACASASYATGSFSQVAGWLGLGYTQAWFRFYLGLD